MATSTAPVKGKGPTVDPALCRCCRSIKKCRLLTVEYEWMGQKEIYSDMFMDCFGLVLSQLDGDNKDNCVCATCVVRLREACAFRQQVLHSEEAFLSALVQRKEENPSKFEIEIKTEPVTDDLDVQMDDRDDLSMNDEDEEDIKLATIKELQKAKLAACKSEGRRRELRSKTKSYKKKNLFIQMKRLQEKLDQMVDKPLKSEPKQKKPKRSESDSVNMAYDNTVAIVKNSYVCPFQNRISFYYCYYCKDQFTNPSELREHTNTHDPNTFESVMENKKIPKIDITRIDCRLCDEKIDTIESLKSHLCLVHKKTLHSVSNEFVKFKLTMNNLKCTECNETFPYFDSLTKHMNGHFGTYVCDMCGACFMEIASLRTHIRSHNKVELNFPCEICGKNLKSKYSRYLHIATVHEKTPTVNCYKCEASFLSYAQRNRHLIEAHGDKRTFPCKLCDKVYNRRKTLMEHNRRNHLKVYNHQCDLCDQKFYLPSRLKEHMATHTGERNFRCEFCDKSYPRLQSLQEHIRSHSNERRYKCDVCNTTFTQNGSLKNHMKSHHQFDLDASFS
ncbi:hypothetical protein K1T71_014600 [Dendrolimus kikuchii]|uniref:Uncharacterized protein n=1 Tax=Dendrolimus kikuchii TaxID=765133 RepID=A0ACC1CEH9_9NEOP|nr:hypothetical protein K1T71_014600 [Dendrolimus kikuchii]